MSKRSRRRRSYGAPAAKSDNSIASKSDQIPPEVLENLPDETRTAYLQAATFQGPLPPPVLFEHYEKTLPGAADRILKLTEGEQAHRHQWEDEVLAAHKSDYKRGQILGFVLAILALSVALICAYWDKPYVATAALLVFLGSGITPILLSRQSRNGSTTDK